MAVRDDHLWPGRPGLLPEETFSSWFARTAAANGLRPGELYRIMQPGEDRNPRDLDRYADIHLIHRLADSTGVAAGDLAQATFAHWGGKIFDNDDGARKLPWLPPAGRENGDRCFGQQFCPLCLSSDPIPYLRRIWRLAFVTTCPVHGRLLHDRCRNCGEPFNVLRQDSRGQIAQPVSLIDPPAFLRPHPAPRIRLGSYGITTDSSDSTTFRTGS